jgi:hypothetical protein
VRSDLTYVVNPALTAATLQSATSSPVVINIPVKFTATPTGGTHVQYRFQVVYTPSGGTMTTLVLRDWTPGANTITWTPTIATSYTVQVYANEVGGSGDVHSDLIYVVNPVLTAVTLHGSASSPVVVNTPVTFTATPTGGTHVQYRFQVVYTPSGGTRTTLVLRDWTLGANTVTWTPTTAGAYTMQVYANEVGSSGYVRSDLTYTVSAPTGP